MASQDFIISAKNKLREGDTGNGRPNSEAVQGKIGGSINALIDSTILPIDCMWPGYYSSSNLFTLAPIRIEKLTDIIYYRMSVAYSGTSSTNGINMAVYDDAGAFVNNLFGAGGAAIRISGNSGNNVLLSYDVVNSSGATTNAGGHTIQFGTLNLTTLQPGYILVPSIEAFGSGARSIRFVMHMREQ